MRASARRHLDPVASRCGLRHDHDHGHDPGDHRGRPLRPRLRGELDVRLRPDGSAAHPCTWILPGCCSPARTMKAALADAGRLLGNWVAWGIRFRLPAFLSSRVVGYGVYRPSGSRVAHQACKLAPKKAEFADDLGNLRTPGSLLRLGLFGKPGLQAAPDGHQPLYPTYTG